MASNKLDDLTPRTRPLVDRFLALCVEARVFVVVAQTLRTLEESAGNILKGTSWVSDPLNSKHVDARERGWDFDGADACDVVIVTAINEKGKGVLSWNGADPRWLLVRDCAVKAGLKWGVVKGGKQVDPGHVENPAPARPLKQAVMSRMAADRATARPAAAAHKTVKAKRDRRRSI